MKTTNHTKPHEKSTKTGMVSESRRDFVCFVVSVRFELEPLINTTSHTQNSFQKQSVQNVNFENETRPVDLSHCTGSLLQAGRFLYRSVAARKESDRHTRACGPRLSRPWEISRYQAGCRPKPPTPRRRRHNHHAGLWKSDIDRRCQGFISPGRSHPWFGAGTRRIQGRSVGRLRRLQADA